LISVNSFSHYSQIYQRGDAPKELIEIAREEFANIRRDKISRFLGGIPVENYGKGKSDYNRRADDQFCHQHWPVPGNIGPNNTGKKNNKPDQNRQKQQSFVICAPHKFKISHIHHRVSRVNSKKRNQQAMFPESKGNNETHQQKQNQERHIAGEIAFNAETADKIVEIHIILYEIRN